MNIQKVGGTARVSEIGDEKIWILLDVPKDTILARQMAEGEESYAGFDCEEEARHCLQTIPEHIRKNVRPVQRHLREVLYHASQNGLAGIAVFDKSGRKIKRMVNAVV